MKSEVEELLKFVSPVSKSIKGMGTKYDLSIFGNSAQCTSLGMSRKLTRARKTPCAILITFHITKYNGDPLRWLEFWEQFDIAVHYRELENIVKFPYLREYLTGKAAAVIREIPIK